MNLLSREERQLIAATYLVANTPTYLYREFQSDPTVQRLADENTAQELSAFVRHIDETEDRDSEEVALAYAAIVGLTLKGSEDAGQELESLGGIKHLTWTAAMTKQWRESRMAFSYTTIQPGARIETQVPTESPSTSSHSIVQPPVRVEPTASTAASLAPETHTVHGEEPDD